MPQDLYEQIVSKRGGLAKIGEKIPGYRGYMEAQARREADHQLREYIEKQFQQQMDRVPVIERRMMQQGGIQWIDDTAALKTVINTFLDKIRTAPRGGGTLFSNMKVDNEALARLYAFDETMLDYVDDFGEGIDKLEAAIDANEGIGSAISSMDALVREATSAFGMRDQVILGLAGEQDMPDFWLDSNE